MFQNDTLKSHLQESSTIKSQSVVFGEWNMNYAENIDKIGNYKNRPDDASPASTIYADEDSLTTNPTWSGYNDSSTVSSGGVKEADNTPYTFVNKNEKEGLLYSLVDCLGKFRPRSGINKLRYFDNYYTHHSNSLMAKRPRFYISSKNDKFKYWTSFRRDLNNYPRGIGKTFKTGTEYYIDDAAPFVKYKNAVPANRLVVKMQTMVGEISNGPYRDKFGTTGAEPFYENPAITLKANLINQRTPLSWRIEYLDIEDTWRIAKNFDDLDLSRVIGADGYVELAYGLHINGTPVVQDETYKDIFTYFGEIGSSTMLPLSASLGDSYLVPASNSAGTIYIWNGSWVSFTPTYDWFLNTEEIVTNTPRVTDMTSPSSYVVSSTTHYREFQNIYGIRVVVDTVNKQNTTFDLIEMSPRLVVDLTEKTTDYSVKKVASDIGNTGIPVGQLLASTGTLNLFDYDQAFNYQNIDSILYNTISQNIQIKFYESIIDVDGIDYHVPIKTMYVEGFPQINSEDRKISLTLRDLYFYFETTMAPQILLRNVSLSAAVSILLDSIGFSNYYFKRLDEEKEDVIPYFFIAPDTNVAQALNDLADSTQTAMFFDEYNNLICMSKDYMMPKTEDRTVDITLYGSTDSVKDGIFKNKGTSTNLTNIMGISSESNMVYNGGKISYVSRYIQKSYGTLREASLVNRDQVWKYKPVLLWEVAGTEALRSVNNEVVNQSSYSLSAVTLNSKLVGLAPTVNSSNDIVNNVMDFGPSVYWISRYQGYFSANGEIIKYDAVEHSVSGIGNVWVSSVKDYQYYFSKLPFGGKIFPTGNVRIYCEPEYESDGITPKEGVVLKHGRGQFGTKIVEHTAGFADNSHWTNPDNIYNCKMEEQYIFSTPYQKTEYKVFPSTSYSSGATSIVLATSTTGLQAGYFISDTAGGIRVTNGTKIKTINHATRTIELSSPLIGVILPATTLIVSTARLAGVELGSAGVLSDTFNANAKGTIKDFLNESYYTETAYAKNVKETSNSGSIQASALVLTGYQGFEDPLSSISYVATNNLDTVVDGQIITYDHFGTRMRIIGKIENADISSNSTTQLPLGAMRISSINPTEPDQSKYLAGAGGGLAIRVDTTKNVNNGYYFEISALSQNSVNTNSTVAQSPVQNVFFYKLQKEVGTSKAIPILLWSGQAPITVDDGDFVGMSRLSAEKNPTVFDLAVEQEVIAAKTITGINATLVSGVNTVTVASTKDLRVGQYLTKTTGVGTFGNSPKITSISSETQFTVSVNHTVSGSIKFSAGNSSKYKFYLYINNVLMGTAIDTSPIEMNDKNNKMALFVRGTSKVMFEHIYALANNPEYISTQKKKDAPLRTIFSDETSYNSSFSKYTINRAVQQTYLSGINPSSTPKYLMYYDEFGTIMRECAYFNIRYDKAYPAIYSKISPTFNNLQGYAISGFLPNAYGAEFMVFNTTDSALNLDETSGNYLRIQGLAFTQQSTQDLTVDEYFSKNSDYSSPQLNSTGVVNAPSVFDKQFIDIQNSRNTYGKKDFTLNGVYIQTADAANKLMEWMVNKVMKQRKSVGVSIFANPMIQLGDIVKIDYVDSSGYRQVADEDARFIVYNIEYNRTKEGPTMNLYLSEVV